MDESKISITTRRDGDGSHVGGAGRSTHLWFIVRSSRFVVCVRSLSEAPEAEARDARDRDAVIVANQRREVKG